MSNEREKGVKIEKAETKKNKTILEEKQQQKKIDEALYLKCKEINTKEGDKNAKRGREEN